MRNLDTNRAPLSSSGAREETLKQTDEKLKLVSNELLRMEDEGGLPLTKKQKSEISTYARARKRIQALLFTGDQHEANPKVKE